MRNLSLKFNKKSDNSLVNSNSIAPATMFNTPPTQVLGGGYSSDMQMPVFSCLTPSQIEWLGGASSVIYFSNSVSYNEFSEEFITISYSSSDWIIFSKSSESVYINYVQDTSYTQSFYFFELINMPQKAFIITQWGANNLNTLGLGAYNVNPEQFRITCGDMFAAREDSGAGLFATLRLSFSSEEDKTIFNYYAGGSFLGIADAYVQINTIVSTNLLSGYFEFSVYQIGGDQAQLAQMMAKNTTNNQFYVSTCDFTAMSDCSGVITTLLDYSVNSFPSQVGFINGEPYGNAVSRGFIYDNYTAIGLQVGNSTVNPIIEAAIAEVSALYLLMQAQEILVDRILDSQVASYIEPYTSSVLSNFTQAVSYNNGIILDPVTGIMGCYLTPTNCLGIVFAINTELAPINTTLINNIITGFKTGYVFSLTSQSANQKVALLPIGSNLYYASNNSVNVLMPNENIVQIDNNSVSVSFSNNNILSLQVTQGNSNTVTEINIDTNPVTLASTSSGIYQGSFPCNADVVCTNQISGETCNIQLTTIDSGIF